jgi:hypothetical protein
MESDIPLLYLLPPVFVMLLFCSSCGKKQEADFLFSTESQEVVEQNQENGSFELSSSSNETKESILLKLAKQADITVPVGFEPVLLGEGKDHFLDTQRTDLLCFGGEQLLGEVLHFYRCAMERSGWKIRDLSSQHEGLLLCEKIHKDCVVSIRPERSMKKVWSHGMYIYLFIQKNQDG